VQIVVEGTDLPGGADVLVGLQVGKDVVDIVPATDSSARWAVDVDVVPPPSAGWTSGAGPSTAGVAIASSTSRGAPDPVPTASRCSGEPS
jgi:hypothetical protein